MWADARPTGRRPKTSFPRRTPSCGGGWTTPPTTRGYGRGFTIARNALANSQRARRRRSRLQERLTAFGPPLITVQPDSTGDREGITSAFIRLRPADRDLLTMAGIEGLDAASMAQILGCSTATLHVRLHRARRRFRDELDRPGPAGPTAEPTTGRASEGPRLSMNAHPEEAR